MATINKGFKAKIRSLSDTEKKLSIQSLCSLTGLTRKSTAYGLKKANRWQAYKAGKLETVSYEKVMSKHRAR